MSVGPQFEAVHSEKLSELISRQLLTAIIDGHYPPGSLLPPERDLAAAFRASRIVVREALSALNAWGVVSVRQGRGTQVNEASEWDSLDPQLLLALYGDVAFEQLLEMRRVVEPTLAAMAAERITPQELERLNATSDLPDDDSQEQHVEHDTQFHLQIARAAHNPVLLTMVSAIGELLRESRRRTFRVPGEIAKGRAHHAAIFKAIKAHDPVAAADQMKVHLSQVESALKRSHSENPDS
ncbi:MAG: FadR family transcriptional regulator [Anaerolineales bacterium]|nr:FadR family transcriptional regulator [Anaerolineales bacterium]